MTEPEREPETPMEASFLAALPDIEAAIRSAGFRHRMSEDEIAEFGSTVKLTLIESRYRALARYEGRSSLRTYLNTVVRRLLIDFLRARRGKWRVSAQARRLGSAGVALERMISRDGLTPMEATTVLSVRDGDAGAADAYLAIANRLPARRRWILLSIEDVGGVTAEDASLTPEQAISVTR